MNKNKKIKFRRGILSLGMLSIFAIPTIAAHAADHIVDYGLKDNKTASGYYAYAYTQSSSDVAVAKIKEHYALYKSTELNWSSYTTDTSDNGWAQTDTIGTSGVGGSDVVVGFKSQHESEDQIAYDQAGK